MPESSGAAEPLLSLRSYIDAVESFGELRRIRGAHWDLRSAPSPS